MKHQQLAQFCDDSSLPNAVLPRAEKSYSATQVM